MRSGLPAMSAAVSSSWIREQSCTTAIPRSCCPTHLANVCGFSCSTFAEAGTSAAHLWDAAVTTETARSEGTTRARGRWAPTNSESGFEEGAKLLVTPRDLLPRLMNGQI